MEFSVLGAEFSVFENRGELDGILRIKVYIINSGDGNPRIEHRLQISRENLPKFICLTPVSP